MLLETQSAFGRFLLIGEDAELHDIFVSDRIAARKRLMIHRNNVMGSLIAALGATFPMVERACTAANFRAVAARFIASRPPAESCLSLYGVDFAPFLAAHDLTAAMPFLPDLARLEWVRNTAFFAADEPVLDLSALIAVPESIYPGIRFQFHPSAQLLASRYSVATVWQSLHDQGGGPGAIERSAEPQHVLVQRHDGAVAQRTLMPAEAAFLIALKAGATLEDAALRAGRTSEPFDLQAMLVAHLSGGTLTSFATSEPTPELP